MPQGEAREGPAGLLLALFAGVWEVAHFCHVWERLPSYLCTCILLSMRVWQLPGRDVGDTLCKHVALFCRGWGIATTVGRSPVLQQGKAAVGVD